MAYQKVFKSPVGDLTLTSDGELLTGLSFGPPSVDQETPLRIFDETAQQLSEYFDGTRQDFDLPIQNEGTPFQQRVWVEVSKIPYGESVSYKDLAVALGDLKAIRAVGTANGKNNLAIIVPCHRVIGSDGSLTGYAWGTQKKEWLLRHENHPRYRQQQLQIF